MSPKKSIELDPRLLFSFQVLAEELHFGRAAARLHMTQPPLSQHIKRLEEIVGTSLFVRTTRSVSLTPAGQLFRTGLERVSTEMETMLLQTRRAGVGDIGVLGVGLTPGASSSPLVEALYVYRQQNKDVALEIHEVATIEMEAALRRNLIDVGLGRPGANAPDVQSISVFREPICVAVRADHPLAKKRSVLPDDLNGLPIIGYRAAAAPYLFSRLQEIYAHFDVAPTVVQSSQLPTMLTLVEAGVGAALAPESAIRQRPGLRVLRLRDCPVDQAEFQLVSLRRRSTTVARHFIQWMTQRLALR